MSRGREERLSEGVKGRGSGIEKRGNVIDIENERREARLRARIGKRDQEKSVVKDCRQFRTRKSKKRKSKRFTGGTFEHSS